MKLKSTLIVLTLGVLTGCKNSGTSRDNNESSRERARDAELRHKLECKRLEKQVQDEAAEEVIGAEIIDSVFYSSKENSCLVAKHILYYPKYSAGKNPELLEITDLLGGQILWTQSFEQAENAGTVSVLMNEQINKLK